MIEIFNNQNKVEIDIESFKPTTEKIIAEIAKQRSITIAFVTDKKIKKLNTQFRGKQFVTDVLSFQNDPDDFNLDKNYLGDIVISAERANQQAIENNLSLELEIKQLILHGVLHLCGYDHETDDGEMNELELKLRDKLKIN